MIRKLTLIILGLALVLFFGCVSQNKYRELETELSNTQIQIKEDKDAFSNLQAENEMLLAENKLLQKTIEDLKLELQDKKSANDQTKENISSSDQSNENTAFPYSILLSSCQQQESIQRVISEYKASEFEPYVIKVDLGKKGIWWRILAGHFENREAAVAKKNDHGLVDKIVLKKSSENQIDTDDSKNVAENDKSLLVRKVY